MLLTWPNGGLYIGADLCRGPDVFHIALMWNNVKLLTGAAPPEGYSRCLDGIEIMWAWPRFRGVRFARYSYT